MQAGNGAGSRECPEGTELAELTELADQQSGQAGQNVAAGPDGQPAGSLEQARRDAELFRGVFRNMNAGVMVLRPVHAHGDDCADFTLLDINPAGERLSCLTRAECTGSLLSGLLPAPVAATLREALARAWRSGIAEHLPSFLYSDKIRGCWRHYFISRADSGDLLLIYEDVTERYMALANLAAGEEKYRALVENTPDIIMRFGGDLRLTYVNAAISPYLGPPEALMGRGVAELGLAPQVAEFWARQLRGVLESGRPVQTDYVFHGPAGRVLFDWRLVPERGVDGGVASVLSLLRDVTRQRSTEHDFRTLFRKLITSFAVHEALLDDAGRPVDFRFLTVNPAFEAMAGRRAEEVLGRTASELFGPQDPAWIAVLGRVALTGEPLHTERYSRNMGKWLEMTVYRVRERQFAIIAADVTERRNARRERRLSAARLSALHRLSRMDAAPERSIMRFALEQAVRLTGSELGYLALVDDGRVTADGVLWSHLVTEPGMPAAVSGVSPQGGPDERTEGRTGGRAALAGPWTEVARTGQPEIRNGIPAGGAGAPGTMGAVNTAETEPAHRVGGISLWRHLAVPVLEEGRLVAVAGVANKDLPYERADRRQLELFMHGMWEHIARRRAMVSLRRAKEAAEAASRSKDEFLANMSHELRTPLNGVLGMLQLLDGPDLSEERRSYLGTAVESGHALLRIIDDLLDLSALGAGGSGLRDEPFDPAGVLRQVADMVDPAARRRGLALGLIVDALPRRVRGDAARLRQILYNLVANGVKFTHQGGVDILACPVGGDRLLFTVRDTGIGIPEEKLAVVCEPFAQVDGSSTRRYQGAGLGLGIVRRLVARMGGTMTMESEEGVGTSVHVCLPLPKVDAVNGTNGVNGLGRVNGVNGRQHDGPPGGVHDGTLRAGSAAPASPESCAECRAATAAASLKLGELGELRALRVLVAEDDLINRLTVQRMLEREGHRAVCVENGADAVRAAGEAEYDLILMDIQMPEMDGTEAARRINDLAHSTGRSRPPIVALTAHALRGDRERFLASGMDDYIAKPLERDVLRRVLQRLMN
ncbi:PAS domain-containing protein [Nitratidesulfovibrio termitidis]|uniref:PAS domain-containing protein n=1 Tax=Nitratidesulfovibrio termitidis TaxID=42252 RepID=UPI0003FAC59B|nr:PAS domain-containing protein [Nitratidesulfovibrio termitidis]